MVQLYVSWNSAVGSVPCLSPPLVLNSPSCTATHIGPVRQTARPGEARHCLYGPDLTGERQQDCGAREGQGRLRINKTSLGSFVVAAGWSPLYLLLQLHYGGTTGALLEHYITSELCPALVHSLNFSPGSTRDHWDVRENTEQMTRCPLYIAGQTACHYLLRWWHNEMTQWDDTPWHIPHIPSPALLLSTM